MLEFIRHIDYSIFLFFNNLVKDSFLIKLLVFVCAKYLIFFFFLIIAYMWWLNKPNKEEEHKSKRAVIYTMLSLAWAFLIDQLITLVFIRNRPYVSHPNNVKELSVTTDPTSFPSAHSILFLPLLLLFILPDIGGWEFFCLFWPLLWDFLVLLLAFITRRILSLVQFLAFLLPGWCNERVVGLKTIY